MFAAALNFTMKFSVLKSKNPYFNLAVEEYLLKYSDGEYFLLWQNEPTVVIGKNQNVFAEVNVPYTKEKGIHIARRITGGGAVYHDLGNLNFSYITNKSEEGIDFEKYTLPIIEALKEMGLDPVLSGRNDILISEKKISGNAQTVFGNRVLHHGTLLYSSNAEILSSALNVDKEKLKAKAISSVRSRVANIKDFLKEDYSVSEFQNLIKNHIITKYNAAEFEIKENKTIEDLCERNASDAWVFPSSNYLSALSFTTKKRYDFGNVEINMELKNDRICNLKISGDFFGMKDISDLEKQLSGIRLAEVSKKLANLKISDYIMGMQNEEFLLLINT